MVEGGSMSTFEERVVSVVAPLMTNLEQQMLSGETRQYDLEGLAECCENVADQLHNLADEIGRSNSWLENVYFGPNPKLGGETIDTWEDPEEEDDEEDGDNEGTQKKTKPKKGKPKADFPHPTTQSPQAIPYNDEKLQKLLDYINREDPDPTFLNKAHQFLRDLGEDARESLKTTNDLIQSVFTIKRFADTLKLKETCKGIDARSREMQTSIYDIQDQTKKQASQLAQCCEDTKRQIQSIGDQVLNQIQNFG